MNVMFYMQICIVSLLLFLAYMATTLQLLLRSFCFMIYQLSFRKSFENGTNFHLKLQLVEVKECDKGQQKMVVF